MYNLGNKIVSHGVNYYLKSINCKLPFGYPLPQEFSGVNSIPSGNLQFSKARSRDTLAHILAALTTV